MKIPEAPAQVNREDLENLNRLISDSKYSLAPCGRFSDLDNAEFRILRVHKSRKWEIFELLCANFETRQVFSDLARINLIIKTRRYNFGIRFALFPIQKNATRR